jgi:UDP-N-acetyl-D-mannosaminuronic acid dehydrogenase
VSEQRSRPPALYGGERSPADRRRAFTAGEVPVAVYGLGKMGLPLAAVYADVSGAVTGVDVDPDVIAAVAAGDCPVDGEPGLPAAVSDQVAEGALDATTDGTRAAADARVHVVIVPTVVDDGEVDLSTLEAAVRTIGAGLDPGDLVVVESTVPPRTCRDRVAPWLEAESGLAVGEFGLAFCPERTMSGRALEDITGAYPKVVGGVDAESRDAAELIYGEITDNEVIPVADATTAECVKVFEGVYRDVNIALANELARLADELAVDVTDAIEVANTQPFCDIHDPGPGVGGHCIPYYPYFLISEFDGPTPLMRTARRVNDAMPRFTVEKTAAELADAGRKLAGSTVVVLGLTYRPGVDETRASPGIDVAEQLRDRDADVYAVDPVCTTPPPDGVGRLELAEVADVDPDAVVLVTAHEAFESLEWDALGDAVVVDGRRALSVDDSVRSVYAIGDGSGTNR